MKSNENPKDRFGLQKVPMILFPTAAVVYGALAQRDGAKKYGPYNWRSKPIKPSIFIDACLRHIYAWWDGEELAEDSRVPHLGHALACLAIIIDAIETGNCIDDRPPKGAVAKLLEKFKVPTPQVFELPESVLTDAFEELKRQAARGGKPCRRPAGTRAGRTTSTPGRRKASTRKRGL